MINFDGKEVQEEFNKVFGNIVFKYYDAPHSQWIETQLTIDKLSVQQLWWLTKFAKHVRGRCRNNSAFNNYMNRNFPNAQFSEIPKQYTDDRGFIKHYQGLKITVNGET